MLLTDHGDISPLGLVPTSQLDKMAQLESFILQQIDSMQSACVRVKAWRLQTIVIYLLKRLNGVLCIVPRGRTLCDGTAFVAALFVQ